MDAEQSRQKLQQQQQLQQNADARAVIQEEVVEDVDESSSNYNLPGMVNLVAQQHSAGILSSKDSSNNHLNLPGLKSANAGGNSSKHVKHFQLGVAQAQHSDVSPGQDSKRTPREFNTGANELSGETPQKNAQLNQKQLKRAAQDTPLQNQTDTIELSNLFSDNDHEKSSFAVNNPTIQQRVTSDPSQYPTLHQDASIENVKIPMPKVTALETLEDSASSVTGQQTSDIQQQQQQQIKVQNPIQNRLSQGAFRGSSGALNDDDDFYSDDSSDEVINPPDIEDSAKINDKIVPIKSNEFYRGGSFNKKLNKDRDSFGKQRRNDPTQIHLVAGPISISSLTPGLTPTSSAQQQSQQPKPYFSSQVNSNMDQLSVNNSKGGRNHSNSSADRRSGKKKRKQLPQSTEALKKQSTTTPCFSKGANRSTKNIVLDDPSRRPQKQNTQNSMSQKSSAKADLFGRSLTYTKQQKTSTETIQNPSNRSQRRRSVTDTQTFSNESQSILNQARLGASSSLSGQNSRKSQKSNILLQGGQSGKLLDIPEQARAVSHDPLMGKSGPSSVQSKQMMVPNTPIAQSKKSSKISLTDTQIKRRQMEQNAGIEYIINEKKEESRLSQFWSKIILLIHTYNFVTIFFFLGIAGFPEGIWLLLEIVSEVIIAVDFVLRLVIRLSCPAIWEEMWLLHDKGSRSKFHFFLRLLASVPQSLILCMIFSGRYDELVTFEFALLRCLKLLRLRQISQYFAKVDFKKRRSRKNSFIQGIMVVYYFFLATHFIGCMWLLVARLESDPEKGWFSMAGLNAPNVTTFDKYIESLFFVVATMTGLGYGNIVPSTNSEWLVDSFIMITGASIYANFFANFAVEIQKQNKKQIDNNKKFDQAKQFIQQRQVADSLNKKVRHYFNNLRLNFSDFSQKYEILNELPDSLQGELSLVFNRQLIQSVKFFQLAEPNFIMAISRLLKPKISIAGEYVVRIDEVANKMYFINSGVVEILATDNSTILAYQGAGCYFGEIGVFLTGKRSCSVRIRQSAILFLIGKNELQKMLERFPMQAKFLRAVGRQRLKTTNVQDLIGSDASEMEKFEREELDRDLDDKETTFGILHKMSSLLSQPAQPRMQYKDQKLRRINTDQDQMRDDIALTYSRQFSTKFSDTTKKPKIWQTKHYNKVEYFLIVPFSPLFYFWNSLLVLTVIYDTFMVPFSIALSFDFYGFFYAVDVLAILVYMVDIFMRSKLAITNPTMLCFDRAKVMHHYVNSWLILDLLACLPFEYFMLPFSENYMQYTRYVRFFRLFKFGRIYELIKLIQTQSDFPSWLFVFVKLFFMFIFGAHFMSCIYIFIGSREDGQGSRFDGQTLFGDMLNRDFITLQPASEMSKLELYIQFLYLSSCTMGAVMYGDIIPFTLAEQLFTFCAMLTARIYLAFVFAEAANYLSQLHVNKSIHNQKTKRIQTWMKQNNFPGKLIERVNDYHSILWDDMQGIDEQEILKDLPESLRHDIRSHMLQNLLLNWEAFPKSNSQGAMQTVIKKLKLMIIPKGEYVIRVGQVAEDMYFIVKGICRVLTDQGEELAILKQGQNFGEMALLDFNSPLRQANVVSMTKCSLAVLTKNDFDLICEMYPIFQDKIFELAKQRKIANLQKEKDAQILQQQTTTQLGVVLEEEKSSDSDDQSNYGESSSNYGSSHQNQNALPGDIGQQSSAIKRRHSAGDDLPQEKRDSSMVQSGGDQGNSAPVNKENNISCHSDEERSYNNTKSDRQETVTLKGTQDDELRDVNFQNNYLMVSPQQPQDKMNIQVLSKESMQSQSIDEYEAQHTDRLFTDEKTNNNEEQSLIASFAAKRVQFQDHQKIEKSPRNRSQTKTNKVHPSPPQIQPPQQKMVQFDLGQGSSERSNQLSSGPKPLFNEQTPAIQSNKSAPENVKRQRQLSLQRRKSSIIYPNVDEYISISIKEEQRVGFLQKCLSLNSAVTLCITLASIYNIVFIPLSFAFRVKFEGVFLAFEVLTIFFYLIDICLRWNKLNNFYQLEKIPDSRLNQSERKMKNDPEQLHRNIRIQKVEIGCSIAACLPIVSILSFIEIYRPWPLVCLFASVRLVKIRPIFTVFDALKNRNLNFWRIVEVLTYYYLICHFTACLLLANAAYDQDARDTWLRRIPVPQAEGIREGSSVFGDMSDLSVYVHAIYFVVNTISHVAIGDITSVTTNERAFNAFLILLGTFIYSFLFGNITAIVSSLAPSQNMEFYQQYNFVMNKLKNGRTPLKTIHDVNQYFDYQWSLYKGLNVEKVMDQLPESIRSDVLFSRYQDAIETSLIFRESTGQIDVALASSIFKKFHIQIYQNQEFILKVGQHCTDTLIILDGQVQVYGMNKGETLGILSSGSHYSNDLAGDKQQASLAKFISLQKSHLLMNSPDDNFDCKSLVHLVAKSFVVIGCIKQQDLDQLYFAYPKWQTMMQTLNRFMFEFFKISVEKHAASLDKPINRRECAKLIQNHLTYSTERVYEDILEMDIYSSQLTHLDLTRHIKQHYIQLIQPSITHKQLAMLQKNCMMRHMQPNTDGRSKTESYFNTGGGEGSCATTCCKDMYIQVNSKPRRVLELLQLINLIYIAFMTPMYIAFKIKMDGLHTLLESVSLVISLFVIILNFRTPVIVKGRTTLEFRKVALVYWQNGILIDLCGIVPFNLIFRSQQEHEYLDWFPLLIVITLQSIRIVSSWQALKIFAQFEVYIKSHNFLMGTLKATLMLYFLGHFMTCGWHLVNVLEALDGTETWAMKNQLDEKQVSERYLLCFYSVINVVTSVGYGDIFPVTDLERVFFILMITAGDVLFALAFGLIAQLVMQKSKADEKEEFVSKMLSIQQIMAIYNIPQGQRERVEQYFSFVYFQKTTSTIIDHQDLYGLVPNSLIKEIIFHQNNELLLAMFSDFDSENLIKELSTVLQSHVYLPADYIINKGEIGEQMYFIVDGQVLIIAADKQTVVNRLKKGQYFGEIAIFFSMKRTSYVQADTFCILNSLRKADLDEIVKSYPLVAKKIQEKTKERMFELNRFNQLSKVLPAEESKGGGALFTNLIDDSLLSPDDEQTQQQQRSEDEDGDDAESYTSPVSDRKIKSAMKSSPPPNVAMQFGFKSAAAQAISSQQNASSNIPTQFINVQNNDLVKQLKDHVIQQQMDSRLKLIEETASPVIEALKEHSNAFGPASQKLIQAVQEHTPAGSNISRRSSLLMNQNQLPEVMVVPEIPPIASLKPMMQKSNSDYLPSKPSIMDDPIMPKNDQIKPFRQSSHRSDLTSSVQSSGRQSQVQDASSKAGGGVILPGIRQSSFRSAKNLFASPCGGELTAQQPSSFQQQQQHRSTIASQQPYETEAVSVRRLVKNERRLSRITLNRNLTLNQTTGLKLQWTVGN